MPRETCDAERSGTRCKKTVGVVAHKKVANVYRPVHPRLNRTVRKTEKKNTRQSYANHRYEDK